MRRAIGVALACWWVVIALARLGFGVRDSGLTGGGLVMAFLCFLAPAALAVPASRTIGQPLWGLEAIGGCGVLTTLLLLADPFLLGRQFAFLVLLPALFCAFSAPALCLAAWYAPDKAAMFRRWGYWCAALPTGFGLLIALGALSVLSGVLLCLLLAVVGYFSWAVDHVQSPAASPASVELAV